MTIIAEPKRNARDEMLEHCDRLSDKQLGKLHRARHLAEWVHRQHRRATGDLYVTHCYGAEQILVALGFALDIVMRVAALLHDTLEDCNPDECKNLRKAIPRRFGLIAYLIVETMTRKQGKDFPAQLLRAVRRWWWIGLWRIVFEKLADMFFNLSTIEGFQNYRQEMKQYQKADEMLRIFVFPSVRYIPSWHLSKFDELLTSVTTLLPIKRLESITRERELDRSYFPAF